MTLSVEDLLNPATLRRLLSAKTAGQVRDAVIEVARRAIEMPLIADAVLRRADRGDLTVRVTPTRDLDRTAKRLEHAALRLTSSVLSAGFAISAAVLYAADEHTLGVIGFGLAGLALLRALLPGGDG